MAIETNIKYTLPTTTKKIVVTYHTYERAPYDAYLCASIVSATNGNEREINKYIDELTGDGSLNEHFKKLCAQIKEFSKSDIEEILKNNRFPITVVDESGRFTYIEDLDISRVNKKYYPGDISEDYDMLLHLSDIEVDASQVASIETRDLENKNNQNSNGITEIFKTTFTDEEVLVQIPGISSPVSLTYGKFRDLSINQLIPPFYNVNLHAYDGKLNKGVEGNKKLDILTPILLDDYLKSSHLTLDNRDWCLIPTDENANALQEIVVYTYQDYYFYEKINHEYGKESTEIFDEALEYLVSSKGIETFKTKALIKLMRACSIKTAADATNYVLTIKDSREIADFGLTLLSDETKDIWSAKALSKLKQIASVSQLNYIYSIDRFGLSYSLAEILKINDSALKPEHRRMKEGYLANRQAKIDQLNKMSGEILRSGVRERLKRLPKSDAQDSNTITLKKCLNEIAHFNEEISEWSDDKLDRELDRLTNIYNYQYPYVLKLCEKAEEAMNDGKIFIL